MGLQGKVAVVTGGGAGIGRSIVQRLAADGARVAALDIRLETAQKSIELAGGEGLAVVCDVSDSASVDAAGCRARMVPARRTSLRASSLMQHCLTATQWRARSTRP